MAENIYSCFHYHKKCQEDRQAIEELAPKIMEAASNVAWGNVGDIKYTARTDVPNGGAWCDGATYAKEDYPDVYKLLTDGKLVSVDMTTFDSSVNLNGSCGFFGLDDTGFKVPLLKDVYLKAGQDADEFGAESLPNIKGEMVGDISQANATGALKLTNAYNGAMWQGSTSVGRMRDWALDASLSSSTYQNGAKVNPDHVKYRAYVVLFLAEKELSIVNWTNQLDKKTSEGLEQINEAKDEAETTASNAITAITTAKNNAVTEVINSGGAPTGSLMPFAGNTAPAGWLKCDGSAISRTTYAALFAVIGTTYGAGDGSTTFNVPNYSNARFVTSETVAVKGNGKALGITDGTNTAGVYIRNMASLGGSAAMLLKKNAYGTNFGTANNADDTSWGAPYVSVGVTKDSSKSGITGSVSLASACNFIIKH